MSAIAFLTNSGTGVGPGVNNISIFLMLLHFLPYTKLDMIAKNLLVKG